MNKYLISFAELALKKGNRKYFVNRLKDNIHEKLNHHDIKHDIKYIYSKFLLETRKNDFKKTGNILKNIFGIAKIVPVYEIESNYEKLKNKIIPILTKDYNKKEKLTFGIFTNRAYKIFPKNQIEINREIGGIVDNYFPNFKVDLDNPDLKINLDVRGEGIYISYKEYEGLRGLPEGTEGKGLLLLSGGIDSPVAGYLSMKRGLKIDFVHFHTPPFTGEKALKKVMNLAKKLKKFSSRQNIRFYKIDISPLQKQILDKCNKRYTTLILRSIMLKISDLIAQKFDYDTLLTGDSLGQVASQTISALSAVSKITDKIILRPLIGYDKETTIRIAKNINTFEKSIEPYDDCCSIFIPKHPILDANSNILKKEFKKINMDSYLTNYKKHSHVIKI